MIQRWSTDLDEDVILFRDGEGKLCFYEDVEKLEKANELNILTAEFLFQDNKKLKQLNAEMLEVLYKLRDWEGYTIGQYEDELKSIIEKAEGMRRE